MLLENGKIIPIPIPIPRSLTQVELDSSFQKEKFLIRAFEIYMVMTEFLH